MRLSLGANLRHRGDLNSRFGNLWSHLPSFTPPTNLFAERGMSLKVTHGMPQLPTSFEQDELERKIKLNLPHSGVGGEKTMEKFRIKSWSLRSRKKNLFRGPRTCVVQQ